MAKEQIARSPRYPTDLSVTLYGKHGITVVGQVKNVSLTGMLLIPDEPNLLFTPNADVNLKVYVSEGNGMKSYKIPMRVARYNEKEAGMMVDDSDDKAVDVLRDIVLYVIKNQKA